MPGPGSAYGPVMFEDIRHVSRQRIAHPKGDILHGLKNSDKEFHGFGEAYFSFIKQFEIKGWKRHNRMHLNLLVPVGSIRFVVAEVADEKPPLFAEYLLSSDDYALLSIPPGYWMAFQGGSAGENLLLNIASIEHDPSESDNLPLEAMIYPWPRTDM